MFLLCRAICFRRLKILTGTYQMSLLLLLSIISFRICDDGKANLESIELLCCGGLAVFDDLLDAVDDCFSLFPG